MPTNSTRLALKKPSTADQFSTADLAANWEQLDKHPGTYICTSTTRPSWGAAHNGMRILETDTDLEYQWTGTAFKRVAPKGYLNPTSYAPRTTELTTTSNAASGASLTSVQIAVPGGRRLQVSTEWYRAESTTGALWLAIYRDTTLLSIWGQSGLDAGNQELRGNGGSYVTMDNPGAGTFTYYFRFWVNGTGTARMRVDAGVVQQAIGIYVTEV